MLLSLVSKDSISALEREETKHTMVGVRVMKIFILSSSPVLTSLELESAKWSGSPLECEGRGTGFSSVLYFGQVSKLLESQIPGL